MESWEFSLVAELLWEWTRPRVLVAVWGEELWNDSSWGSAEAEDITSFGVFVLFFTSFLGFSTIQFTNYLSFTILILKEN